MDTPRRARMHAVAAALVFVVALPATAAGTHATVANPTPKETLMSHRATGPFDVKIIPQKADNPQAEGAGIGRMALDKRFHGDLDAASQGEMIAFRTAEPTSAGYVAMERVTGSLHGRKGSFVLQHHCTMARGVATQGIEVVPDSGTGELVGLSGSMTIVIAEGGAHSYVFDYTLD